MKGLGVNPYLLGAVLGDEPALGERLARDDHVPFHSDRRQSHDGQQTKVSHTTSVQLTALKTKNG